MANHLHDIVTKIVNRYSWIRFQLHSFEFTRVHMDIARISIRSYNSPGHRYKLAFRYMKSGSRVCIIATKFLY